MAKLCNILTIFARKIFFFRFIITLGWFIGHDGYHGPPAGQRDWSRRGGAGLVPPRDEEPAGEQGDSHCRFLDNSIEIGRVKYWYHKRSAKQHCLLVTLMHRISIQQEGKRGGGMLFFPQIEPNWPLPNLRDAGLAGWVNCFSPMPRAQNRAAEGSILLCRRNTLTIWV